MSVAAKKRRADREKPARGGLHFGRVDHDTLRILELLGGFDERYKNAYCEDSDMAMAARAAGKYVWYVPSSEVINFEHQSYLEQAPSQNTDLQKHNIKLLLEKWQDVFKREHHSLYDWHLAVANAERHVPAATRRRRQSGGSLNILYLARSPPIPPTTATKPRSKSSAVGSSRWAIMFTSRFCKAICSTPKLKRPCGRYGTASTSCTMPIPSWRTARKSSSTVGTRTVGARKIRVLCAKYDIDVVFCSYIFQSKLLEYVPSYVLKVIDTHDKMGDRYEMLRANGQPLEFFSCTPAEEGAYLRRADVVVARREEEARYFNSMTGRETAIVIPHVEPARFIDKTYERLDNVGLVASPNRINLAIVREFLETVDRLCGDRCPFTVNVAGQVKEMADRLPALESEVFRKPWVRMSASFRISNPSIGTWTSSPPESRWAQASTSRRSRRWPTACRW